MNEPMIGKMNSDDHWKGVYREHRTVVGQTVEYVNKEDTELGFELVILSSPAWLLFGLKSQFLQRHDRDVFALPICPESWNASVQRLATGSTPMR